jgi:AraC-like DNA-binding protein
MMKSPRAKMIGSREIYRELKNADADIAAILTDVGIDPRFFEKENIWIDYEKFASLLERVARELNHPFFGMHVAQEADPRDVGPLGYLYIASPTLGDFLLKLQRYYQVFNDAFSMELSVSGDTATISFEPSRPSFAEFRHVSEFLDAWFIHTYQDLIGEKIPPIEVRFIHSFDGDLAAHEKYLSCPAKFDCVRAETILPRSVLASPLKTADSQLLKIETKLCDDVLERQSNAGSDLITRFERVLVDQLPSGRAKAEIVAAEMGMSERTLARRLVDENTTFAQTLDTMRHDLSLKYIQHPDLQLSEISFLLGYANQSSFCVAFKRWTGKAPLAFRIAKGAANEHGEQLKMA